jgi:predicted metal-binding protein
MKPKTATSEIERFIARARKLGADDAHLIDAASIVTAAWVRLKCQFGCEGYDAGYCCPPHTPTHAQTQAVIDCYRRGILIHCTKLGQPTPIVTQLEREIFLAGFYKAFGFGAGPCSLCSECPPEGCRHRERARPSLEACGIDVYATAHANGLPIEVVKNRACPQHYYGLILID